jgi:Ca-activated chloride channel homolog
MRAVQMLFRNPIFFVFIPIIAGLVYFVRKRTSQSSIVFSNLELTKVSNKSLKLILLNKIIYLWALAMVFFVFALARPQILLEKASIDTEGIDIVLAIDSSGSMLAEDFKIQNKRQNRLFVVKRIVEEFIQQRVNDRIGLVTFAARAYTVCPLTSDHDWLIANLRRIEIGSIEDGTAIGSGVMSSLGRLENSQAESKIIILLTDGENNAGNILPIPAAGAAKALGVKVYAIGVGSKGPIPFPMRNIWGETVYQNVHIGFDEHLLQEIARITDAKYFIAYDTEGLRNIYKYIDELEKTKIEETGYRRYKELFYPFAIAGMFLLFVYIILTNTIFRKIP